MLCSAAKRGQRQRGGHLDDGVEAHVEVVKVAAVAGASLLHPLEAAGLAGMKTVVAASSGSGGRAASEQLSGAL